MQITCSRGAENQIEGNVMSRGMKTFGLPLLLCIAVLLAGGLGCEASAAPLRELTAVMDEDYPPYVFRDREGNLQGILIDQWKLWSERTSVAVHLVGMEWDKAQREILEGRADVIDTIFQNAERAKVYDFTAPYANLDVPIFFHKDIGGIESAASLQGFAVGVKAGDACIEVLKRSGVETFEEFPSYEAIVNAAAVNDLRVFCMDKPPALYYLNKKHLEADYRMTAPLYTGQFHRAVVKGRSDVLLLVEDGFRRIAPREYEAIDRHWLGLSLDSRSRYLKGLFGLMAATALAFVVAMTWAAALRRNVAQRTADLRVTVDALQRSEKQYRELVESANSVILRWGREGRIRFINPYGLGFFGYTEAELFGQPVMGTIVPETETGTNRNLRMFMEDIQQCPEKHPTSENENIRKNGERVWIAWTNRAIATVPGAATEILSIGRDISEQKKLQAQLLQAQKMESIGRLAGGIAHDFNNLLAPILGYSEMMLNDMAPGHPQHEQIQEIHHAALRAKELTGQLLAFGRKQVLDLKSVDLCAIITEFEKILRRAIRENIRIHVDLPATPQYVRGDAGQIGQVLMNLAVNAQDAMPGGGQLTICVPEHPPQPTLPAERPDAPAADYAAFTVSDTGSGLAPAALEHLFEPFFTTKEVGKGTGLGLATVYGIVKQHEGHIEVLSEPGQGAVFRVFLPRTSTPATAAQASPPLTPRTAAGQGKTILVAEDDFIVRDLACEMLRRQGYRVIPAEDPRHCQEILAREPEPIDLLLTDVVMPVMNGRQLFELLQASQPGLRVLYMSGHEKSVIADQGILDDDAPFLHKPFSISMLAEKVLEVLGRD
jgi:PAS domain S-box-containing protein